MNRIVLVCLVSIAMVGCGDSSGGDGPPSPDASQGDTWTSIYGGIIDGTCNSSGCHGNPSLTPAMMSAAEAYTAIVGVAATGSCSGGGNYVTPGDPDASVLMQVLDAPNCANNLQMPIGGQPLGADQRASIRAWIMSGAPNN
jgi:hypothetical protein